MGDRLGTQHNFFSLFYPFNRQFSDFTLLWKTYAFKGEMLSDFLTWLPLANILYCCPKVAESKSNSLGDGSFKNGLFMGSSSLAPIIKIFSPVFFTVNLFLAPIDRILCHGQFWIEAQSLQNRSDLPLSIILLQLLLHILCTSIDGMAPKRSHPAANSCGSLNTPVLIQSLKLSNIEPC